MEFRTDILILFPGLRFLKYSVQLGGHRNGHLLAGLELLYPDSPAFHIDVLPLQQNTVFQTLPGEHADVVDDTDFRFVHDVIFVVGKNLAKLLLLFLAEGLAAKDGILFLPCIAQKCSGAKWIFSGVIVLEAVEDFPESLDFTIMSVNGLRLFSHEFGELLGDPFIKLRD